MDRREFVRRTAAAAAPLTVRSAVAAQDAAAELPCPWGQSPDRVWLGPDVWANPLQDWAVVERQARCLKAAPNRNVQLLTAELSARNEPLAMSVRISRVDAARLGGKGSAGFTLGIRGPLEDYRNRLIFGQGLDAGLTMDGRLFIGLLDEAVEIPLGSLGSVELRLRATPAGQQTTLTLTAANPGSGAVLGELSRQVRSAQLAGNVGLTANYVGRPSGRRTPTLAGVGRFGLADWRLSGPRIDRHSQRQFGPVFFTQYTLHRGTLKLTAQLPPLADDDERTAELQLRHDDQWQTAATAEIDRLARTATFRIDHWDATVDVPVRVRYHLADRQSASWRHWEGLIRRDPVNEDVLTVADISCNIHAAFPNDRYVRNLGELDPDLLAFTGDQFYESTGGYGIVRSPLEEATLDYLRKWLIHGWTWRELTRDRPSVSIPDDHDVYQGNIWGEGGAARQTTQEAGGYTMAPEWVNVVHRTQTSHHPDPPDDAPAKQGISVYFGPLTYGRVSFAVLADRMFKTGPDGVAPPTEGRADHVKDPDFDPRTADVPGAELLGPRQMEFLRQWADDWEGAVMKAVISQTVFTSIATTHGGNRMRLAADYDTNGWPQTARNNALRLIRTTGAVHLAGDQHLPAVVRYGIDEHDDATVAFAGPAVNVGYPRWWEPLVEGQGREPGQPPHLGQFTDAFGHPLTMLAVFNPAVQPKAAGVLQQLNEKGSGYGVVRFHKPKREVTIECWPYLERPAAEGSRQFPGWPVVVPGGPPPKQTE